MSLPLANDPTNVMGRRVVAYLIDAVVASFVVGLVFFSSATRIEGAGEGFCDLVDGVEDVSSCFLLGDDAYVLEGDDNLPVTAAGIGYSFLVFVVLTAATGASIGKFVMGLRVVDAQGQRCGFGRAAGRWVMLVVDSFCFIGFFVAAFTHPHRRLGDMAAGTFVVGKGSVGQPIGVPIAAPSGYAAPQPGVWQPPPGPMG